MSTTLFKSSAYLAIAGALLAGALSAPAASGPTTRPQPTQILDPLISADVQSAVAGDSFQRSEMKGGSFTNGPFEDLSRDGVLIGFRVGVGMLFSNETIRYIQPIYLTPAGEVTGKGFGDKTAVEHSYIAKAPVGYAVGAVNIFGGNNLAGITLTYMRFNGTRIDPTDIKMTPKIGSGRDAGTLLDGDGTPIIGITGRHDDKDQYLGLGLIFVKPTAMVEHR